MAVAKAKPAAHKKRAPVKRVMDIAHPGTAAAQATARPVIVSNRPLIKDDVITGSPAERLTAPVLGRPHKIVIKPLSGPAPAVPTAAQQAPTAAELVAKAKAKQKPLAAPVVTSPVKPVIAPPVAPVKAPEPAPIAAAESPIVTIKQPLVPQPATAPPAGVPALHRDDKQLSPQQIIEADKLAQQRATKLEELIESEQYFLPINAVQQRRSQRFILLGGLLIVVLALAWYDVALDANLAVNVYNLPHTHFFSIR